jgi:tetratricopeptide (TPR) repeat protein
VPPQTPEVIVHYARLHRALATFDSKSKDEQAALVQLLRKGPPAIGKVLAKGPLGAVLGTLNRIVSPDEVENTALWGAVLEQLPEQAPDDLRFDLAADVLAMGDAARARPALEDCVAEAESTDAEAWLYLGDARAHTGDAQGALDAWEHAGTLDDALGAAWSRRGLLYAEIGMPDAAIAVLSEAVVREDEPQTWHTLGRCLVEVGLTDDAMGPLGHAIDGYGEDSADALYARGSAKALKGDADGAFQDLLTAGTEDATMLTDALEDEDYARLSDHPRWASISG